MQIEVTITGISPLLMNRFTDEAEVATSSGHSPGVGNGNRGTPREQAEKTAYRDPTTGELFLPGPNIFAAIIDAGKFHKLGKNKVTTQKSSLVPAGLLVLDMMLPLGARDFEVDSRRIVNPATGGARLRHRARLDKWAASFTLDVDETMFSADFVRVLVDDAGKKVGVCDYRPAKRGPFGRFVVTNWKVSNGR
ncbi:MAG: hypothetical protein KKI08_08290 [Armatimonadetes bacterium]|nr:hypothetical protein [Armatimonadota bacterium]